MLSAPQQAEQENEWGNGSVLVDLKEHGGDIPVSKGNVEEYIQVAVSVQPGPWWPAHLQLPRLKDKDVRRCHGAVQAYAHFLLVESVAPQYDAFEAGFRQVLLCLRALPDDRA